MFRLEKIFQQDDNFFINSIIFFRSFIVFLSIYIFSILEFNSIFDLLNYNIYKTSGYFYLSLYFPIFYLLFSFFFRAMKKRYITNFLSFLLNDIIPLFITAPFILYIFFILKIDFNININTSYLLILTIVNLLIVRKIFDTFYTSLMNNNVIQRNIMLVGSIESIEKILEERKDKINIYKCCLIKADNVTILKNARRILKIPVFTEESEMRVIIEYHELGQIWILDNNDKNLINYFLDLIVKFSVDIIIINIKDKLKNNLNLLSDNLINNKYSYSNYQTSKFYGLNLFIKVLLDKIFSIIFLLFLSPVFILSIIAVYIEDGFPLFTSIESAGWDGRRFNVYKLRILKNNKLDNVAQVKIDEKKLLKIGKIIKRLHIDEIPQFFNILIGDMSIVGPRPHVFKDDLIYAKVFIKFLKRNKTAPGLTGWAQVNGYRGGKPTSELMKKRMEHDLWYMNNWNVWLDLYIILKTFFIMFTKPKT
jgi:lipopolysaccharide/colanic/teichoic acid biosynthesis glycosyltransferase